MKQTLSLTLLAGCISLAIFLIFADLGSFPIALWDESRLAVSALEMLDTGQWGINTFHYAPDTWNIKFPTLIILEAFSMKIFGLNEFAFRLPSALAVLFTCIYLVWFSQKILGEKTIGILAVFILLTAYGYMDIHAAKTGDYDAMLTMFLTISNLSMFAYLQRDKNQYYALFGIGLIGAIATKSVAGGLFLVPLFFYILKENKLRNILQNKLTYGIILFPSILFGLYLYWRQQIQPDYFKTLLEIDVLGRATTSLSNHGSPFYVYFHKLIQFYFQYWILFFIAAILIISKNKSYPYRPVISFVGFISLLFLGIISLCQTRLDWYCLPVVPLFSLVAAILVFDIYALILKSHKPILAYCFLTAIFINPLLNTINKISTGKGFKKDAAMVALVDKIKTIPKNSEPVRIVTYEYRPDILFYVLAGHLEGKDMAMIFPEQIQARETILFFNKELSDHVAQKWVCDPIESNDYYSQFKIIAPK